MLKSLNLLRQIESKVYEVKMFKYYKDMDLTSYLNFLYKLNLDDEITQSQFDIIFWNTMDMFRRKIFLFLFKIISRDEYRIQI